ncbi:MAG: DUF4352 domain-containing protein [Anaerorhabdus sp.]
MKIKGILVFLLLLAGCSSSDMVADPTAEPTVIPTEDTMEVNGYEEVVEAAMNNLESPYGDIVKSEIGTVIETTYFDMEVQTIERLSEYDGYTPMEEYTYYAISVNVTNTSDTAISVGNFDFVIFYQLETDSVMDIAYSDVGNGDMYPDEKSLEPGESVSGLVLFDLPTEALLASFGYVEIHVNVSEEMKLGNVYIVTE